MNSLWENTGEWEFMQEPLWRWTVFLVAIGLIMTGWAGIVRALKGAL